MLADPIMGPTLSTAEDTLIGASPLMRAVEAEIGYAANSDAKVLITGESGVGKEVVARMVHLRSRRGGTPMVTINCAGIPDTLLESALFGHERGSFTGAVAERRGLLEAAHRGTIFLDEVCEMSLRMQALLLRFMENGEIQRVGAARAVAPLDVRVIAATNRDPLERVQAKEFREDLYYRLNVARIVVPPLRERPEDIPVFLSHFLRAHAERHRVRAPEVAPDALACLRAYSWPGNVRELRNVVERMTIRPGDRVITAEELPADVRAHSRCQSDGPEVGSDLEDLWLQMVSGRESFWEVVYPAFMRRDLTRDQLRQMLRRGLRQTSGSYKMLAQLFNMQPTEYKRFLNFLRKHDCHVPFQAFRTARPTDPGI
jgi:transcriptional regulator with PAS, ATPase and Fis domain